MALHLICFLYLKSCFFDTSAEFLFGGSTEYLNPENLSETEEFMKAFDRSLLGLALLLIFGPVRWPLYFDPYWKAAYTKVHAFVDRHVQRALERQKKPQAEPSGPKKYVLLEESAKETQDRYDLRMQILNVFFPARDTAAIAFANIIFNLARHSDEWKRLKTEVAAINPEQKLIFEFF